MFFLFLESKININYEKIKWIEERILFGKQKA